MDERRHQILLKGQNKTKESRFHCQRNGSARLSLPRGESEKDIPGPKSDFPLRWQCQPVSGGGEGTQSPAQRDPGPPGTKQAQRGRLKDSIFEKYGIPLLRLPTNGIGEIEKVRTYLERTK